jgi:hypothetical protein
MPRRLPASIDQGSPLGFELKIGGAGWAMRQSNLAGVFDGELAGDRPRARNI